MGLILAHLLTFAFEISCNTSVFFFGQPSNKAVTEEEVDSAGILLAEVTNILGEGTPVEELSSKQKDFLAQLSDAVAAGSTLRNREKTMNPTSDSKLHSGMGAQL